MVINSNGQSISTATVTVLWINLAVNLYNLTIIWFNDSLATEKLLGYAFETTQYIISIQTILTTCTIMISTIQSTSWIFSTIKYWVFALTSIFLILDIIMVCSTTVELFLLKTLNEFWAIKTNHKESVAPVSLYLFVAYILTIYLVFKLYAVYKTIRVLIKLHLNYIHAVNYISSVQSPSYDRSVMEFCSIQSPPPPYNIVQK